MRMIRTRMPPVEAALLESAQSIESPQSIAALVVTYLQFPIQVCCQCSTSPCSASPVHAQFDHAHFRHSLTTLWC